MKTLYLVRHAKSSHDDGSIPDIERPLNNRGKRDAPFMGKLMKKMKVHPTLLVSSPAKRALTTAKLFAEQMDYNEKEILIDAVLYSFNADQILSFVAGREDKVESLMLFFHNPTVTDITNFFTGEKIFNLPTSSIAAIEFKTDKWSDIGFQKGKLAFLEYPKLHKDELGEAED